MGGRDASGRRLFDLSRVASGPQYLDEFTCPRELCAPIPVSRLELTNFLCAYPIGGCFVAAK